MRPSIPHPNVPIAESDGRISQVWFRYFAELNKRVPVTGTATFAAATTVDVTLPVAEVDTNYHVLVEGVANRTYFVPVANKTTTGFRITASASNSDVVGWAIVRL